MKFLLLAISCIAFFTNCSTKKHALIKIEGAAQGTTYHITYISADQTNYQVAVDSILKKIDSSLSTYLPASIISAINRNDSNVIVDKYFVDVFNKAVDIAKTTNGIFDVTVGPLINAYGFGSQKKMHVDSAIIDSLRSFTGYEMVTLQGNKILKQKPGLKLDFNAIAQGYTVDVIAGFLENNGVENYLVELGGELKAKGKKFDENWKVGIDQPKEDAGDERSIEAVIELNDKALCTSGNYRKYYVEDGKKYAHIIDPRTGYPARQNILSSTVIADDCATADAYATAFMVMGLDSARQFLQTHADLQLEVYFIYEENGSWKTFTSDGIKDKVKELPVH